VAQGLLDPPGRFGSIEELTSPDGGAGGRGDPTLFPTGGGCAVGGRGPGSALALLALGALLLRGAALLRSRRT
jgi:hypothetical protein